MHDSRTIFRQATTAPRHRDYGLPVDLLTRARSRIVGLAAVFWVLSLLALVIVGLLFRNEVDITFLPQHITAMVASTVVIAVGRSRRFGDMTALNVGLAYEICACWIISFAAQHMAIRTAGHPPEITWASMIIVVFPMVVPLPPRRLLTASILAAASSPGTLVILHVMGRFQLSAAELIGVSISPAFATALAWFGARSIYAISLDVSRARQMGAYRLETRLGEGGMGEVWRADHRMLARPAAIKLISPRRLGTDAAAVLSRFEQEAQATALLCSPHTVEVYDFGRTDDGSFYYVMELLDGLDLKELVSTHGTLPAARAVHILRQACHSLGEAHAAGLVHRDIKPANLFVCRYGGDFDFVKVLDFGLVKQRKQSEDPALTQKNQVMGTPAFLPPEMALGAEVDGRADLYALGCVAYWLLTGVHVFEGETAMAVVAKHLNEKPRPPSQLSELEIPADLDAIVLDCLRKKPDERPQSAEELAERLGACGIEEWSPREAMGWWQLRVDEPKQR